MRISREKLLHLIREEYETLLTERVSSLNEQLPDVLKRDVEKLKDDEESSGVATSLVSVLGSVQKINAAAKEGLTNFGKVATKFKDKAKRDAILDSQKALRASVQTLIKKSIADVLKKLENAKMSVSEAEAVAAAMVSVELANINLTINVPPTAAKASEPAKGSVSTKPSTGSKPATPTAKTKTTV